MSIDDELENEIMDRNIEEAVLGIQAEERELIRQFWIQSWRMPPELNYDDGLKWIIEQERQKREERENFGKRLQAYQQRTNERCRDRMEQAGFDQSELTIGIDVPCRPQFVPCDDPRYEAFCVADALYLVEQQAVRRVLGIKEWAPKINTEAGETTSAPTPDAIPQVATTLPVEIPSGLTVECKTDRVTLFGNDKQVLIDGAPYPRITPAQYQVIKKIIVSAGGSLKYSDLQGISGDAVNTLKRLAQKDGWRDVIYLPRQEGRGAGYSIK